MRRAEGGVKLVNLKGRGQKNTLVGHPLNQIRLLRQIATVFDGIDASLDAHSQAGAADGVAHRPPAQGGRRSHQGFDLFRAELHIQRAVTGPGTGSAGSGELDNIGPDPAHFPHLGPHRIRAIGHSGGH